MDGWSTALTGFVAGNIGLGLAVLVALAVIAWLNRSFVRDILTDEERHWRAIAWFAVATSVALLLWGTLFDNWLQIIAEPYRLSRPWESERVVFDPVAEPVRWATVVLLVLALPSTACLVARHVGGYGIQLALLVVATVLWAPLFVLRQRADIIVGFGQEAAAGGASATVAFSLFVALKWALGLASLLASYLFALMLIAPAVTLVLDVMRLRTPAVTQEAQPFFSALEQRASEHEDVPLSSRQRPIRRAA